MSKKIDASSALLTSKLNQRSAPLPPRKLALPIENAENKAFMWLSCGMDKASVPSITSLVSFVYMLTTWYRSAWYNIYRVTQMLPLGVNNRQRSTYTGHRCINIYAAEATWGSEVTAA